MSENNKNVCEVCGSGNGRCGQCGNMCGWNGAHLLRWILGIIIIVWVFCLGMRVGQMTGGFDRGYGHMYFRSGGVPMMGGTYPVGGSWTEGENVIYSTGMMPATQVKVIKTN